MSHPTSESHPTDVAAAWPADDPSLPASWVRWAEPFAALFWMVPVTFYAATASRGVGWIDSAMIVHSVFLMKTGSWVNVHNLFLYIGRLWLALTPFGPPAFSLNLLAALFGAYTVWMMFLTGLRLTHNLGASAVGALALMLSHSLWWHSTTLEVYTLNTALIATILWLVVRWNQERRVTDLYAAVLAFGFGISNHVMMGLYLFAFLALFLLPWEKGLRQWSVFGTGAVAFLLGAQIWLTQVHKDTFTKLNEEESHWYDQTLPDEVDALKATLYRATGGKFQEAMFPTDAPVEKAWRWRLNYVGLLVGNFPSVAFPVGLLGLWTLWRDPRHRIHRSFAVFFTVGIVTQALWSANYIIWDMFAFGLPVWTMFGLAVMLGFDGVFRGAERVRNVVLALSPTLLLGPVLYAAVESRTREDGFWHDYFPDFGPNLYSAGAFIANPNKRSFTETETVIAGMAEVLPVGAHLWDSDGKCDYPFRLYYQQVLGARQDVKSHLIFGPFLTPELAAEHAAAMRAHLEQGDPVFVSSLARPERIVLAQLFRALGGDQAPPLGALVKLPQDEFARRFPRYEFARVDLPNTNGAHIFEIRPRH